MPNMEEVGTTCWWFCRWLIQNKSQGSATQQDSQSWDKKWIANKTCCPNPMCCFQSKDPLFLWSFFQVFSHDFVAFSNGRTSLQMTRDPSVQLPRPDQRIERSRSKTYPKRTQQTGKCFFTVPVERCLLWSLVHFVFRRQLKTAAALSRITRNGFSLCLRSISIPKLNWI